MYGEKPRCCDSGLDSFRVALNGKAESSSGPGDHILKYGVLTLPLQVVRDRNRVARPVGLVGPHHDELVRVWIGQGRQQRRIDDAEDCRVCAYSDGEREHGYGSEARALTKYAESETKISQEGFKERKSPLVTVVFPSLFDAAPLHKGIHERSSFLLTILRRITMDGLFVPTYDGIHAGSTPRRNGRRVRAGAR